VIARMKRLTLLCLAGDRDDTVRALAELGAVHVTDVRTPEGEPLEELRALDADLRRALEALEAAEADRRKAARGKRRRLAAAGRTEAEPAAAAVPGLTSEQLAAETLAILARRRELGDRGVALRRELARYEDFGEFDLATVRELQAAGVGVALGVARGSVQLTAPDGVVLTVLQHTREIQHFCLAADTAWEALPDLGADYEVVTWPERPLQETRDELAAGAQEDEKLVGRLQQLAAGRAELAASAEQIGDALRVEEVRSGMGQSDQVVYLAGYVPVDGCEALSAASARHGWGVVFDDPVPGEDVPVLLKQASWVRPVRTVFDFLHIYPGYWEWDVGWIFLPFFSLFFAMIVGDAGYATLLLILTAVLQWRLKKVPHHVFHMMYIVGGATLVWGVINGTYFGIPVLPPVLESLQVSWVQDRDNLIDLCFFIGALHLTFAHVWNAVTCVRDRAWSKFPAQVGWLVVVWSLFFLARQAVLGRSAPSFLLYSLVLGIVLVALFMKTPREFKESWIDHALLPLTMISSFVDILSYIRLFAVGYASVAVLAAFNEMAASIGFDSVLTAVAASVLLLFANALNIVLAGLGVLVHAVRLNTLEFSTHKGLAWQGYRLYTPFKRRESA
jgi:V/A-type H+/Na+-transporting ATPase subunit I